MPTISVIVPIYNAEEYLDKCIESILYQTFSDLQIILINDGSTDHSLSIAQQYAAIDKRIEVYSQANKGQSAARNIGLHYAIGDYISFIDADDYIDCDFYEEILSAIGQDKDCVQIGYKRVFKEQILEERCARHFYQFTSPCIRLYRHKWLTRNNLRFEENKIYEDVLFSVDLWATRPQYTLLSYTGYNYTINPASTTSTRQRAKEEVLFSSLRQRFQSTKDKRHRLLILYTAVRLKWHFAKKNVYDIGSLSTQ